MTRRRLLACLAAVVVVCLCAAPADAGVVALSSTRCDGPVQYAGGGCPASIWTLKDDGTGLHRVTGGTGMTDYQDLDEWPSWSPDGLSVIFRRHYPLRDSSNQSIWVQSVLGGEARQIGPEAPNSAVREYKDPVWSPDGRYVLFSSRTGDTVPDALRSEVYLMGMDGSIRQVTHGPQSYSEPRFARDGRRILALATDSQGGGTLTSLALDGRDARPVFVASTGFGLNGRKSSYLEYAVSPDGRSLAVNDHGSVYTVEASGQVVRPCTRGAVYFPVAESHTPTNPSHE